MFENYKCIKDIDNIKNRNEECVKEKATRQKSKKTAEGHHLVSTIVKHLQEETLRVCPTIFFNYKQI